MSNLEPSIPYYEMNSVSGDVQMFVGKQMHPKMDLNRPMNQKTQDSSIFAIQSYSGIIFCP